MNGIVHPTKWVQAFSRAFLLHCIEYDLTERAKSAKIDEVTPLRTNVQIDTFFPSSKTCTICGHKLEKLSLAIRNWTCPHCGTHHDRDINASLNIKKEGIRMLKAAGQTVLRS